jgi:hypothetical protein
VGLHRNRDRLHREGVKLNMTDPLGATTFNDAIGDLRDLVTTSYVPGFVTAIVTATAIGVGLAWLSKGLRRFKRS